MWARAEPHSRVCVCLLCGFVAVRGAGLSYFKAFQVCAPPPCVGRICGGNAQQWRERTSVSGGDGLSQELKLAIALLTCCASLLF